MKNLFILFISILTFSISMEAQTFKVNSFYQEYRQYENSFSLTLPGWLMRLGAGIAKKHVAEDDIAREALSLVKNIRKMKLLVVEDANPISNKSYLNMIQHLDKHAFERLISVRSDGTHVDILVKEKKGKIRNLIVLVQEEDEFVFLSLKTKLKYEDLNKFIQAIMDNKDIPVKQQDIPRA